MQHGSKVLRLEEHFYYSHAYTLAKNAFSLLGAYEIAKHKLDQLIRTTRILVHLPVGSLREFRDEVPHPHRLIVPLHHLIGMTSEFGHVITGYALLQLVGHVGGTGAVESEVLSL